MSFGVVLRAPFARRTWAEMAYMLAGAPLAAVGFGYTLASIVFGTVLAVTAVGIPLLVLALWGARGFGALHRGLARPLLGMRVAAPMPPRGAGWARATLADGAGWRAVAYLLVKFPMTVLFCYVAVATWVWGALTLTYPIQYAIGINQITTRDSQGTLRHGLVINGFYFDTWRGQLLVSLVGVVLLLLAPWAVRGIVLLDRLLIRGLLGPHAPAERIRALEETRAHAVDDAAATLRRIERDLHDGAQVKLVALTMQLTMMRDAMPDGPAKELAGTAQDTAREAIAELRELVRGIHPPALDKGLDVALTTLVARSAVPTELTADIPVRPAAAIESIAYFCTAELLANAAKHSGARRARVDVDMPDGELRVRVRDDGSGGARVTGGTGLAGLAERVRIVDGRMDVASPPGGPTVVTVELPSHI